MNDILRPKIASSPTRQLNMPRLSASRRRSGMILLIVLGMLALFSLLVVTYVVFSGQSRTASVALSARDYRGTSPKTQMDEVLKQVVRGTSNRSSGIWGHSLLEDLYGTPMTAVNGGTPESLIFQIGKWPTSPPEDARVFSGQLLRLPILATNSSSVFNDQLTGRLATFLSGPLRNKTFRVVKHVAYQNSSAAPPFDYDQYIYLDVTLPADLSLSDSANHRTVGQALTTNANFLAYNAAGIGYSLIVNDLPFNGTGYGRWLNGAANHFAGNLDQTVDFGSSQSPRLNVPAIFLNHFRDWVPSSDPLPRGGTDETYDVADHSDFHLAHAFSTTPTDSAEVIPSFHRPAIVNYLANSIDLSSCTADEFVALIKAIDAATTRPLSIDLYTISGGNRVPVYRSNPDLKSSNPGNYNRGQIPFLELNLGTLPSAQATSAATAFFRWLAYGPWDVDNDGDGIADSVWLDPGLPFTTSKEGKILKSLAAIHIVDMDGLLNVNAHGSPAQGDSFGSYDQPTTTSHAAHVPGGTYLPHGNGVGPGEIGLRHIFQPNNPTAGAQTLAQRANFEALLGSRYQRRYNAEAFALPGLIGDDFASMMNNRDRPWQPALLDAYQHRLMPSMRFDSHGQWTTTVDVIGNRITLTSNPIVFSENINEPYESRLISKATHDSPFTIEEWERVRRRTDPDYSMLPTRLEALLGGSATPAAIRRSITTRSVSLDQPELPVASEVLYTVDPADPNVRRYAPPPSPFRQLIQVQSQLQIDPYQPAGPPTGPDPKISISEAVFTQLFPMEFLSGQALNINRALGNGIDDDPGGDGQIDEPQELLAFLTDGNGNSVDDDGDGDVDEGDEYFYNERFFENFLAVTKVPIGNLLGSKYDNNPATFNALYSTQGLTAGSETRQLLARELYCLLQLLVPSQYVFPGSPDPDFRNQQTLKFRARRLAQWAINVVDARDADAAMTRFQYDERPFDGWNPDRLDVVWGLEQPELLLRESFAMHDLRVIDSADDDNPNPMNRETVADGDDDYDQYRLPEGSLFLELYAPRTTSVVDDISVPGVPQSIYSADPTSNEVVVDLARLAPSPDGGMTPGQPVWRVAISKIGPGQTSANISYRSGNRSQFTYQLNQDIASGPHHGLFFNDTTRTAPPEVAKIIWFTPSNIADPVNYTTVPDVAGAPREFVFFNRDSENTLLRGGSHLVLGPRRVTDIGQVPAHNNTYRPSRQRIDLLFSSDPTAMNEQFQISRLQSTGLTSDTATVKAITGMVVAAHPPSNPADLTLEQTWDSIYPDGIGISATEPLPKFADMNAGGYYRIPSQNLNSNDTNGNNNGYGDRMYPTSWRDFATMNGQLPDQPFDQECDVMPDSMLNEGTHQDVCTAYLQRLADPERPHDPAMNPYITIDWIPIDVTVFSGDHSLPGALASSTRGTIVFASRYKIGTDAMSNTGANSLLTYETTLLRAPNANPLLTAQITDDPGTANDDAIFRYEVGVEMDGPDPMDPPEASTATLGFLNSSFGTPVTTGAFAFIGRPQVPYANLTWPNRNFANRMELLYVPASHPGQLNQEFTVLAAANPFINQTTDPNAPYGHLLNFFSETSATGALTFGLELQKFLTLIETPSPWTDSYRAIPGNPIDFAGNAPPFGELANYRVPFNRIATQRSPGKININTIRDELVWKGIEWNYLSPTQRNSLRNSTYWTELQKSLRGYDPKLGNLGLGSIPNYLNPEFPTNFAGVFRSPWHSNLGPVLSPVGSLSPNILRSNTDNNRTNLGLGPRSEVTLARSIWSDPELGPAPPSAPLFYETSTVVGNLTPSRYPEEQLRPLTRLSNLVTNHSNVYSVYMTLGYFEVDEATGQIGREYNAEFGRQQRNRAFFIIDRSVPVGFLPGLDLNTDDTILIRRYLD